MNIYWHIQMHKPFGSGDETEIDPLAMLREPEPVIGTGEWDNYQCRDFKNLKPGSVVMVRKGTRALALCRVTGEVFHDESLRNKYCHVNYRRVEVLAWAKSHRQPRSGLFQRGTLSCCRNHSTEQYRYIDNWIKTIEKNMITDKCARLLANKRNIILQGAPGTGKTYTTAALALRVLGVNDIDFDDHAAVMERYESLLDSQIFFTTFHQSMDYEDFVEGLKPHIQTDSEGVATGVTYEPEDGIFKRACLAAIVDEDKNIVECIEDYIKNKINGIEHKRLIPTVTGKSAIYVWHKPGNSTISSRSVNSASTKGEDYTPAPLNIEKIKLQAMGHGVENNWPQYSAAFIEAVRREYKVNRSKPVVLIIDEINRGNVSKIFGELITMLEADKRIGGSHPVKVTLPYSKTLFGVPDNLYIIGTMNTTDRSTGTLDYALRRRFAFVTLKSDPAAIMHYYGANHALAEKALVLFEDVRRFIANPKHINGDFDVDDLMVGHSYFMAKSEAELADRIEFEVVPLINEYINDGILRVDSTLKNNCFGAWMSLSPYIEQDDDEASF